MDIIAQNCACDSAIMEIKGFKANRFTQIIPFIKTALFIAWPAVCMCVCVCEKGLMS